MTVSVTFTAPPEVVARVLAFLERLLGWRPAAEELAGASPPQDMRPPDRPPSRRRRGPPMTVAERKRKSRAKKEREQGCHPAPPNVDSPESYCSPQPYMTPAATSSAHAVQTSLPGLGEGGVIRDTCHEMSRSVTKNVTRDVTNVTDGGTKGGVFSVAVASTETTADPHPSPPLKAPPLPAPEPSTVTPRRAARGAAAHAVRAQGGHESHGHGHDSKRDIVTPESFLTPDGQLRTGCSFRDVWEAAWLEKYGHAYAWDVQREDVASRKVTRLADGDMREALRRIRNGFTYLAKTTCDDVPSLARWWNKYCQPHPLHKAAEAEQKPAQPTTQHHVGRTDATHAICALLCCDVATDNLVFGHHICTTHLQMLWADVPQADMGAATVAAWVEGQNALEVAS